MIDFGYFFFDSDHPGVDGNYAMHAKKNIGERLVVVDPRVGNSDWPVFSGDLLGSGPIPFILTEPVIEAESSRLDASLLSQLSDGKMPEFIPYVVGIFSCEHQAMIHVDSLMKEASVAGYLGVLVFKLPSEADVQALNEALALPITKLHSI